MQQQKYWKCSKFNKQQGYDGGACRFLFQRALSSGVLTQSNQVMKTEEGFVERISQDWKSASENLRNISLISTHSSAMSWF